MTAFVVFTLCILWKGLVSRVAFENSKQCVGSCWHKTCPQGHDLGQGLRRLEEFSLIWALWQLLGLFAAITATDACRYYMFRRF